MGILNCTCRAIGILYLYINMQMNIYETHVYSYFDNIIDINSIE